LSHKSTPMSRIAYFRVSTTDQSIASQRTALGGDFAKEFCDEGVSGSVLAADRPGFSALLAYAREGDEIHVNAVDRLGRDALDVQATVRRLLERGVSLEVRGLGRIGKGVGSSRGHGTPEDHGTDCPRPGNGPAVARSHRPDSQRQREPRAPGEGERRRCEGMAQFEQRQHRADRRTIRPVHRDRQTLLRRVITKVEKLGAWSCPSTVGSTSLTVLFQLRHHRDEQ